MNHISIWGTEIISNAPVTRDSQNKRTQKNITFETSKVKKMYLKFIPEFSSQQMECCGNACLKKLIIT